MFPKWQVQRSPLHLLSEGRCKLFRDMTHMSAVYHVRGHDRHMSLRLAMLLHAQLLQQGGQLGQHFVTGSKRHIGQRVSPVANHSCIHLGWKRCPQPTLRSCSCMAKVSRQMLHSLWASPLSLLAGLFVGRSCEAFSMYVTRRKSDMMLGPAAACRLCARVTRLCPHA